MTESVSLEVLAERIEGNHRLYESWRETTKEALELQANKDKDHFEALNNEYARAATRDSTFLANAIYERDQISGRESAERDREVVRTLGRKLDNYIAERSGPPKERQVFWQLAASVAIVGGLLLNAYAAVVK